MKTKKIVAILLIIVIVVGLICIIPFVIPHGTNNNDNSFRVLAYIRAHNAVSEHFDKSHFDQVTDIVMFEIASFDENGEIVFDSRFDKCMENVKSAINGKKKRLYINLYGPRKDSLGNHYSKSELCRLHNMAFSSGKLENNIKDLLVQYNFTGVFFDYEYPQTEQDWQNFDSFLLSLDKTLGKRFEIGTAISAWDNKYSQETKGKLDVFALMEYDNFDETLHHSTLTDAKRHVKRLINEQGFDKTKLLLGLPFYGRPTNKAELWYDYASYYQDIDEEGFYVDSQDTGLTFSFNTYQMIYDKTAYAIEEGLGGMMVWHYACDLPASNEKSLFNAISESIKDNYK